MRYKELIGSHVWKYSGALLREFPLQELMGTLVMTQRSLQACQLGLHAAQISTQLWRTSTDALTRTRTPADTNLQHQLQISTQSLNIILDMWRARVCVCV